MNVSYVRPLQLGWARAQRMLLRPARLETWLVLGFAAFLSEGVNGRFGSQFSWHRGHPEFASHWLHGIRGLISGFLLTGIGITVVVTLLALAIILLWVNARGRFIFLDDVARERVAIVDPWNRFARLGNSAFLWWIGFIVVCIGVMALVALPFVASLTALWSGHHIDWSWLGALWMFLLIALPFALVVAYTALFFSHFVVPIMYRHGLGAIAGWGRFLSLFRAHPGSFLLYGVFTLVLWIVVGSVIAVIGFMSCCIGFVLFSLPYVSSVLLLPVLVTFRAMGPEFLAQFGEEYRSLSAPPPPAAPVGTPPAVGAAPPPPPAGPPAPGAPPSGGGG
jgi:hypothetical protein